MSRLKVAVVGVGALGRHHARILSGFDDVELAFVVDTDPDRCRQAAETYGSACTTDFRQIVEQVDAACVAVPTVLHRVVASEFLRRGIAVMVEKPLAASLRDAEAIVHLADQAGAFCKWGTSSGSIRRHGPPGRFAGLPNTSGPNGSVPTVSARRTSAPCTI